MSTLLHPETPVRALLTQQEVARVLGVSRYTVLHLVKRGVLRPVRIPGMRPRYRVADVEALVSGEEPSP
jgi:excisionase family DNA binding protein